MLTDVSDVSLPPKIDWCQYVAFLRFPIGTGYPGGGGGGGTERLPPPAAAPARGREGGEGERGSCYKCVFGGVCVCHIERVVTSHV